MFVHTLSPEQRRALLVLARQVIDADRRLAMAEVERLDTLYTEAGLGAEMADAPSAVGDLNLLFPAPRVRVAVVLELLLVGHADGRLDPREQQAVRDVAARLGLDAGAWEACLDWAARYHRLLAEADEIAADAHG